MKYIMCLPSENYEVELSSVQSLAISELESIVDSLVDLLISYNIDEDDIVETIKNDTGLEINSMEE